jgi:KaiC/GvpD/RAD55 family RecA-like ATPase
VEVRSQAHFGPSCSVGGSLTISFYNLCPNHVIWALPQMSTSVRLPNELSQFLQLPGPQSLMIRGPPGSGKTTLGLALLEAASGSRILVTNRVSDGELSREFPWLASNGDSKIEVVDTCGEEATDPAIHHAASEAGMLFEADSPEKREISDFLSLPPPIQEAWSRLPGDSPSTVVIDSWDALVEGYVGRASAGVDRPVDRGEIERRLLRRMARSPTHLILILETELQSQLDYLVNGVVVTRRDMVNDRLERWLSLPKLRGIRIANASYPYTVEGAKFQCIEPLKPYTEIHRGHVDAEPDDMPGFVWPGSRSFAEAFGRSALGRVTLIEVEDEVPDYVVQHLLTPAKIHAVRRGGRVLVIPSPSLSADEIWRPIEDAHPPGQLADQFRVLDVSGQLERMTKNDKGGRPACLFSKRSLFTEVLDQDPENNEMSRWVRGGVVGGHPGLVTMYEAGIESLAVALKVPASADITSSLTSSIQTSLSEGLLHLIAVGRVESPLLRPIRSLASIHIRLLDRQGRVLIYGMKPWTTGFVLAESPHAGPYELLRIV